jgi:hypothetical protein
MFRGSPKVALKTFDGFGVWIPKQLRWPRKCYGAWKRHQRCFLKCGPNKRIPHVWFILVLSGNVIGFGPPRNSPEKKADCGIQPRQRKWKRSVPCNTVTSWPATDRPSECTGIVDGVLICIDCGSFRFLWFLYDSCMILVPSQFNGSARSRMVHLFLSPLIILRDSPIWIGNLPCG